jgi:hypothetical protein
MVEIVQARAIRSTRESGLKKPWAPSGQRVHRDDAAWLRWYFSDPPIAGSGQNSGSVLGLQLQRAESLAVELRDCKHCGTTGMAPRDGRVYASALKRYARARAKQLKLRIVHASTLQAWRDLGMKSFVSQAEIATELPDRLTRPCRRCGGTGLLDRRRRRRNGAQTARPTGNSKPLGVRDAHHAVDEWGLASYGMISRRLLSVRRSSELAAYALRAYYEPGGGNEGALWPLTPAGTDYVARLPNQFGLSGDELLHSERAANRTTPTPLRTAALAAIARQTSQLWDHACGVWGAVARADPLDVPPDWLARFWGGG